MSRVLIMLYLIYKKKVLYLMLYLMLDLLINLMLTLLICTPMVV